MTDYKALYEAQVEENTKLKVEVEDWKEVAMKKNIHPYTGEIIQPKDILNLQKALYELQDKFEDIEQSSESTAYHELEIERLQKENKELQEKVYCREEVIKNNSSLFQELVDNIDSLKHKNELIRDDFCRTEKKLEKEIDSLKKSNKQKTILIRKFRRQIKGLDKVMLSASFQSWREVQVATNPQYTIQDEIDFLNGETTNQELIKEVFEDLYPSEYEYDAKNKTYIDPCIDTDESSDEDSD